MEDIEPRTPMFDILCSQKMNAAKFPILSQVAQDVLVIPITSVSSALVFNTGGRILFAFQSSSTSKIVEGRIYAQNWLEFVAIVEKEFDGCDIDGRTEDLKSYNMDRDNDLNFMG